MARPRRGERVLGPYRIGQQWRIVVVGDAGERDSRFYPTEEQAKQAIRAIRREFRRTTEKTVQDAKIAYEQYQLHDKGNKPGSVKDTTYRLGVFFPDDHVLLGDLTFENCAAYYEAVRNRKTKDGETFSVDSHRNILAEAKTFLGWCSAKKRWMLRNPLDGVEGIGKRKHGKRQLRIDEGRKWLARAHALAGSGEAGAVAAMMALLMGMRSSEITEREVRDVDDEGWLLWIPDSKTEAGRRTLEVPDVLQPYLRRLAEGRKGEERLFGRHWRDWPRRWVKRICRAAGVPEVTAHGMRGLHSSLALEHGVSAHIVAASLGHESSTTTLQSYATPGAVAGGKQRRVLTVLAGGRVAS